MVTICNGATMLLYHFTSLAYLRAIHRYGLTVGDVPTDLASLQGKVGVWLTSSPSPVDNGLEGSLVDKSEARIAIELPEHRPLWRWDDWYPGNVTDETREALEDGRQQAARSWYVYFGWISRTSIVSVELTMAGAPIPDWGTCLDENESLPAVPFSRRFVWQKKMLGGVRRAALAGQGAFVGPVATKRLDIMPLGSPQETR